MLLSRKLKKLPPEENNALLKQIFLLFTLHSLGVLLFRQKCDFFMLNVYTYE